MTRRIGRKRKARQKLKHPKRLKGKLPVQRFVQEFDEGQKVVLKAFPPYHKGMYCLRFHGRVATVKGKRGRCYELGISDGGKQKKLIVHPAHLQRA